MRIYVVRTDPRLHVVAELAADSEEMREPGLVGTEVGEAVGSLGGDPRTEEQLTATQQGRRALEAWRSRDDSVHEAVAWDSYWRSAVSDVDLGARRGDPRASAIIAAGYPRQDVLDYWRGEGGEPPDDRPWLEVVR